MLNEKKKTGVHGRTVDADCAGPEGNGLRNPKEKQVKWGGQNPVGKEKREVHGKTLFQWRSRQTKVSFNFGGEGVT